ncbi:MAG: hypothetical protein HUJ93_06275 [Bacteroidales bacterium]|nr:hypothetical protein [Bacteroidales bacterium]
MVLDLYNADRLYVGHTIFKEVTQFYNGKVIAVNVDNKKARREKRPRAVMISDGKAVLFNDKGSTGKEL